MKKILFLSILVILPAVLGGCSLTGSNSSSTSVPVKKVGSIWKSTDGGKTWESKTSGDSKIDFAEVDVLDIAINPNDENNVLVGTVADGILKSNDGGETWEKTNFISAKVYGLEIDSENGGIVYASGIWQKRGKLFKSLDGGENWKELYTTPSDGPLIISLVIDKKDSKNIYFSTSDKQVIKSQDGGETWKNIYASNSPVLKIAVDRFNNNLVYLVNQSGDLLRSKNGGKNFENINEKISIANYGGKSVNDLAVDQENANVVYLAGRLGIIRSNDAGEKWEKIWTLNDPDNYPTRSLAVNPKNSEEMVSGAAQVAYKSLDGGKTWSTFQFNYPKTVNVVRYSEANPENVFLGFRKQ